MAKLWHCPHVDYESVQEDNVDRNTQEDFKDDK